MSAQILPFTAPEALPAATPRPLRIAPEALLAGAPRPATALAETVSLCPDCRVVVPALLFERDGDLHMWRDCPSHGRRTDLYWKDAALYRAIDAVLPKDKGCEVPECARGIRCDRHFEWTYTIMLNVTGRCNFHCPVCLAGANEIETGLLTPAMIEHVLPEPPARGFRPNVCLIGGEPTVRKDLPELIRAVKARGYVPRLNTNGSLLTRPGKIEELKAAGLEWVILQFDGFDDAIYEKTRGQGLIDNKLEVIEKLRAANIKVQFAVMLVQDLNTDQIGPIIRFALENGIFWVSFYPHSRVVRNESIAGVPDSTHVADALAAIESETGGRIRPSDFVDSVTWLSRLYRVTGREELRQKLSTLPMVVVGDAHDYAPITRLDSPAAVLGRGLKLARFAPAVGDILRYATRQPPRGLLFLTVEKFHNVDTLDLREASSCHMCYVTKNGTVAFDIYNALHREQGDW
ncbi:MAG: radical SAM protein [bacterium]